MTERRIDEPLRVYVAGLAHETNSFSPLPTSLQHFESGVFYRPATDDGRRGEALSFPGYGDAVNVARERGDAVVEGPCFWTQPSGPSTRAAYDRLSEDVLAGLKDGPFDAVVLNLHGAMMAQGVDDCEGDLLARARALVGPDVPIGAILDLHGNVSRRMVESGAVIVAVKEYPHTDYRPRVEELYRILSGMARGDLRPATTLRTIPVLSLQGTTEEPMRGLVAEMKDLEGRAGVLSVTLMHGFPWSDGEETGASLLIVSDGAAAREMDRLADSLADRFLAIVAGAPVRRVDATRAVSEALAAPSGHGPVVIADSSDNPGGGAAADSTFLLRELLDRGVEDAALGMIWDPQATAIAADAGVGAVIPLRVGGKVGPLSGDPLDVTAQVLCVRSDARQRNFNGELVDSIGLAAALRVGGVEVVVNSLRRQVFSPECFTELGVDVANKAMVVVKSSQHFRAGFDPIARDTIYCNAPGSLNMDLARMPYTKLSIVVGDGGLATSRPVLRISVRSARGRICQ